MKKYVLIVEDNEIAMNVEKLLFENLNCIVDCATNGELAVDYAAKNEYDLIIMDIGLPGIDGIETTLQIRLNEKKLNRCFIPIVAVTGNADPTQHILCTRAGINEVIVKPLSMNVAKSILLNLAK
jgi:CheY-like chemotaxis protein